MFIINAFQEGGAFMYVILAFGVFTIGFMIERYMALYINHKAAPAGLRTKVIEYITRGQFQHADNLIKTSAGGTALGRIVSVGCQMRAAGAAEEEVQARMDEQLNIEINAIDKRTGFLAMFGNVATLVGLLGTIAGMIHSFAAVAAATPMERATMLSRGISEAMNCTAFGLIVAVPALVAYAIYQNKTDKIINQLTHETTEIYHDLIFLFDGGKKSATARAESRAATPPPMSV